jgi:hypothetical protein
LTFSAISPPTWEIRPSRNEFFHSVSIDKEVMDIETEFTGWKMCLNVTEFLMIDDLHGFIAAFKQNHPGARSLVTSDFIIQRTSEVAPAAHRCHNLGTAATPRMNLS